MPDIVADTAEIDDQIAVARLRPSRADRAGGPPTPTLQTMIWWPSVFPVTKLGLNLTPDGGRKFCKAQTLIRGEET